MCCDNIGNWEEKPNGECPDCGEPTVDGYTTMKCAWSSTECETCEHASCDGAC